jgi:hypothetical protein
MNNIIQFQNKTDGLPGDESLKGVPRNEDNDE